MRPLARMIFTESLLRSTSLTHQIFYTRKASPVRLPDVSVSNTQAMQPLAPCMSGYASFQVVLHHGFHGLKTHRLDYAVISFPPPWLESRLINASWRGLQGLVGAVLAEQAHADHAYLTRLVR
jgi:hypothetical protein